MFDLLHARPEEMTGVFGGHLERGVSMVRQLLGGVAGDAMVFDAGKAALSGIGQMRPHVVEIQVEADVAVEIAVIDVAGVAFVFAPDLSRGIEVAAESGDAIGREERRKDAVAWTRFGMEDGIWARMEGG
jgi:hypothetical protein